MFRFIFPVLLGLVPQLALCQADRPPFAKLMEIAKVKTVIHADTVAGKTNVLLTSIDDNPKFVFVFAPGGDGTLEFSTNEAGLPITARPRNPAYFFATAFLEKQTAWAAVAVPENYGRAVSRAQRLDKEHIEAFTQAGQRIKDTYPKAKLVLIGHSNGAITAGMQAIQTQSVFDAIVFSAPQLGPLPFRWRPEQAKVPIMFITHKHDNCKGSEAYETVRAAGNRFPVVVIESLSPGSRSECFAVPAPHFFTDVYGEYAEAILKWASSL
jgi:predicted esterase